MISLYEYSPTDLLNRDKLQDSLDFFHVRYLDFFPTGKLIAK